MGYLPVSIPLIFSILFKFVKNNGNTRIMDIDREKFENYMERILEQIELLHKKTDKLIHTGETDKELKLFDNQDLCQLLNVDKRTLQRYRSKGTLKYLRIEGKTFYTTDQVNNFIRICDSL